jgi:hypothetical protein
MWKLSFTDMKKRRPSMPTSEQRIDNIAEQTKLNLSLQTKLVHWFADQEKLQRKFRFAIINKLSRIEAAVSMLLVGQMARNQGERPFFRAEKLEKDAEAMEKFITRQAFENGRKTVRYLYQEDPQPEDRHDRRRKWHGWEI